RCTPDNLATALSARRTFIWAPKGGLCPFCRSPSHGAFKALACPKNVVGEPGGWGSVLRTVRRQCRIETCRKTWLCTKDAFLETLPGYIRHSFNSRFVISGHAQNAVSMEPILRLRRGSTIQAEVDIAVGQENCALLKRRELYASTVLKWRKESLWQGLGKLTALEAPEVAIKAPTHTLSYYLLRNGFITDYRRNKQSLLEELSAYRTDNVLKLDHSRPAARKLTTAHASGYICCIIDGNNIIHNIVVTGSTSYHDLENCFRELKPRINIGTENLVIYTDNACCGNASKTLRRVVSSCCQIPDEKIVTKLDVLHAMLRLSRSCNLQSPRYPLFSRALSQAMLIPSKGDYDILRSDLAKKNTQSEGDEVLKIPKSLLKRSIRRVVPDAATLQKRLERVTKCYMALDAEAEECHSPDSRPITLLTDEFWLNYKSLQHHILSSCISDDPSMKIYIPMALIDVEGRRAIASLAILLFDVIWQQEPSYANSVTELADIGGETTCGDARITFGSEYLRQQDAKLYEDSFHEWISEKMNDTVEHGNCEDTDDSDTEFLDGSDINGLSHADLWDDRQTVSKKDIDAVYEELITSPRKRSKVMRLKGMRAATQVVPLSNWSHAVRTTIHDVMASLPADQCRPAQVFKAYSKKVLDELSQALSRSPDDCVSRVGLHRVSLHDVGEYMRELQNALAGAATHSTMTASDTTMTSSASTSSHTSLPPPFQGRADESIVEFLTRYGLCVRANGWDETKVCWKLSTCLTGRALQVYLSFDDAYRGNYNTIRIALLCHLIKPPYQAAAEFRDRHLEPGESVDTLLYDLNKLYFEAHFVTPSAEKGLPEFDKFVKLNTDANYHRDMILKVMEALPSHIASHLRVMQFTTVDEVTRQARIELATHPYEVPIDEPKSSSTSPPETEDPLEELAVLREEVAALRRSSFGKGRGRYRHGQQSTGYERSKYRRPGQKKWCTYHKATTHWTSEWYDFLRSNGATLTLGQDLPPHGRLVFAPTQQAQNDSTSTHVGKLLSPKASQLLCGWKPLKSSLGDCFQFRVRALQDGELRDTPEQEFTCEIKWNLQSLPDSLRRSSDYSVQLIDKLSQKEQDLFWKEVSTYIKKGWWQEVQQDQLPQDALWAVCFPIKQEGHSTPIRPVVDLRSYNSAINTTSSYNGPSTIDILNKMRCQYKKNDEIMVLDLSKCYYKFRTVDPLYIKVGGKIYKCHRMSFGLVCGASALEEATHHFDEVTKILPTTQDVTFQAWYYDDLTLLGKSLNHHADGLSEYAAVLGWEFPISKRHHLTFTEGHDNEWISHLGYFVRISNEGQLQYRCKIKQTKSYDYDLLTKREVYAIAGCFVDGLRLHPECRSLADILRIYAGQQSAWDQPISDPTLRNFLNETIGVLLSYLPSTLCIHQASFQGNSLSVYADASSYAYGYSIVVDKDILEEASRRWHKREIYWHINRKETRAVAEALARVLIWYEKYGLQCSTVDIYTDSSTVVKWCTGASMNLKTKSLERQALNRLLTIIREHIDYLGERNVSIAFHLIGTADNSRADYLSRQPWAPTPPDYLSDLAILAPIRVCSQGHPHEQHLSKKYHNDKDLQELVQAIDEKKLSAQVPLVWQRFFWQLSTADGIIYRTYVPADLGYQVTVPVPDKSRRYYIIENTHNNINHLGIKATRSEICKSYFWPGMSSDIVNFIAACPVCLVVKPPNRSVGHHGRIGSQVNQPLDRIYIDVTHPHRLLRPVLTVMDAFSRLVFAFELKHGESSRDVVEALNVIFRLHPGIKEIYCDNGQAFKSTEFINFIKSKNAFIKYSVPHQPQTNGVIERFHRLLRQSILCQQLTNHPPSSAGSLSHNEVLRWMNNAVHIYNSIPHGSHGLTPATLFYATPSTWCKVSRSLRSSQNVKSDHIIGDKPPGSIVILRRKYSAFPSTTAFFGPTFYV
ncbi:hypothetical protein FOL47_000485, partial [Perkinsus chesapeaki]